jgi:4-amino-4-deoxy-L-arabinose transferase-like glycosyltransferase
MAALWLATPWGIGIYTDSLVYIGAARNILAGDGYRFLNDIGQLSPVIHYPPGYPLLIAAFAWTGGIDALDAARGVSIFFCAANALLAAYIAYRATLSDGAMVLSAFLALVAFPMVYINSQALTEPPFIFLTLLGWCFLARYLQESHGASLYWFALAVGLGCLVRYVGIAIGLTGAAVIFFHGRGDWRQRFSDAAMFSVVAALPIVAWVVRNYLSAGNAVNRTFSFHLPALADLLPAINTVGHWLLPTSLVDNAPWPARWFLLLVFPLVYGLGRKVDLSRSWYPRLMVYCAVGYGSFLIISVLVCDASLYFDTRTLALAYVATMIAVLSVMTEWVRQNRSMEKSWRWFGFDCAMGILLALQMSSGIVWLRYSYLNGIGFATEARHHSELLKFARNAPASTLIVSNAPDFIFMLTGRRAAMIPHKVDPDTRQPNKLYAQAILTMREQLNQPNAVFVYFNDDQRLWYLPSIEELETNLPLGKLKTVSDGAIYGLKGAASTIAN